MSVPILFPNSCRAEPFPLSRLNDARDLITVGCAYCKREHAYYPTDLMQLFGNVDVDSLASRMPEMSLRVSDRVV